MATKTERENMQELTADDLRGVQGGFVDIMPAACNGARWGALAGILSGYLFPMGQQP